MGEGRPCHTERQVYELRGGATGRRADACAVKREARLSVRGWKSPPPPHRGRGVAALEMSEHEALGAREGVETGKVEAEGKIEPSPEKMKE